MFTTLIYQYPKFIQSDSHDTNGQFCTSHFHKSHCYSEIIVRNLTLLCNFSNCYMSVVFEYPNLFKYQFPKCCSSSWQILFNFLFLLWTIHSSWVSLHDTLVNILTQHWTRMKNQKLDLNNLDNFMELEPLIYFIQLLLFKINSKRYLVALPLRNLKYLFLCLGINEVQIFTNVIKI